MVEKLTSETIFSAPNQVAPLSIIAQPGTEELAAKMAAERMNHTGGYGF